MSRPGHQIYEEEMILKCHGFPVWFGDPYGRAEIEIGDIGYMSEGMFVRVMNCPFSFNEFLTTPVDFNGPVYSQSLERREAGAEAGVSALPGVGLNSHISFTSSRDTCAILNVEEGVADYTRCSDVDKDAAAEFFLQNARKWIAEAVKGRRISNNISINRLILVTGFYKSANWEAAALSLSSSRGNLSFTINTSQAGGGISFNWDSVQHLSPDYSTGHRHPPRPSFPRFLRGSSTPITDSNEPRVLGAHGDITRGTNNPVGPRVSFEKCCHQHADRNQCIFLRGFRIRGRLGRKDQVVELLASKESNLSWGERFMRFVNTTGKTSKPPSDQSCQRSSSAYDYLEPIEEFPDTNFCDQLYDAIAVEKFMKNNSDFVLVHDDELIGILERLGDAAAPDSEPGSSSVVPHAPSISNSIQKIIGNIRVDSGLTVLQTSQDGWRHKVTYKQQEGIAPADDRPQQDITPADDGLQENVAHIAPKQVPDKWRHKVTYKQQGDIAPADDRPQQDFTPADDRLQENVARIAPAQVPDKWRHKVTYKQQRGIAPVDDGPQKDFTPADDGLQENVAHIPPKQGLGWRHNITHHPMMMLKDYFRRDVVGNLKDIQAVDHEIERVGKEFVSPDHMQQGDDIAPEDDRPHQDIVPADDSLQKNVALWSSSLLLN